jgi:hypothetical protein
MDILKWLDNEVSLNYSENRRVYMGIMSVRYELSCLGWGKSRNACGRLNIARQARTT